MRDERVPIMYAGLTNSILKLLHKERRIYKKNFKTSDPDFDKVFALALKKALHEIENRLSVPCGSRKLMHMFCGQQFTTREAVDQHIREGGCKPSLKIQKALAAKDRVLELNRKKASNGRKT